MDAYVKCMVAGLLALSIFTGNGTAAARTVEVAPDASVIVIPPSPEPRVEQSLMEAATELQKHLALITGSEIPIKPAAEKPDSDYTFYVGIAPESRETELAEQETRWIVGSEATHIFGEGRQGTLYAVYSFLQDQLNVHWIAPGDEGIVYREQNPAVLTAGTFNWLPKLRYRSIRLGDARVTDKVFQPDNKFAPFYPDLDEHNAFARDVFQWQLRMRMYGSRTGGSHAFSSWWKKYGQTRPDYFALNKFGKREPVMLPKGGRERSGAFVKICPGNPEVADQIVADWLPRKDSVQFVSAGVNDGSSNFCRCEDCLALDVRRKGENWDEHLTDRYVYLSNRVAREIRKHREDAFVTIYAYQKTLYPPRELKVEPNTVVQLVPYVDPLKLDQVKEHFEGWRKAGAAKLVLRPNYHHKYLTTAMPTGIEKQMFDVFQLAYENGCIQTDYDSLRHQWTVTGISDYILAKSMAEPEKNFGHWAREYYSGFGAAAGEVRDYFEYWRHEVWEKRLRPNIITISNLGGAGNFDRGLLWSLDNYYSPEDFEKAGRILEKAAGKELAPRQKKRLEQLRLANQHALLTYRAVVAKPYEKSEYADELMRFRLKHKDDLRLSWKNIVASEIANGDITGMMISDEMKGYLKPWIQTDLFWKFRLDPGNVGLDENWRKYPWTEFADWYDFRTDRSWEKQFEFDEPHNLSDETAEVVFSYDGIAWYAIRQNVPPDWRDREVYLRFGAVDESCWIYVNGELAGQHVYKNTNDWKTPFEIRIDELVDWDEERQTIVVRVEDTSGLGGVWRPVWLVSKPGRND